MRAYSGPRIVVFSAASSPRIPGIRDEQKTDKVRGQVREEEEPTTEGSRGLRGEITNFSDESALSLAKLLSSIAWEKNGECLHVTLTYHLTYPTDKEQLQDEKAQLVAILGRKVVSGVWRLEFQNRKTGKVPHWHILVWIPVERTEVFTAWLFKWWAKRTENQTKYGAHVSFGREARASWYLALHHSKGGQDKAPFPPGRWWGYINRAKVVDSIDLQDVGSVNDLERIWFARLYRRATCARTHGPQGFSWFLPREWQSRVVEWIHSTAYRAPDPF